MKDKKNNYLKENINLYNLDYPLADVEKEIQKNLNYERATAGSSLFINSPISSHLTYPKKNPVQEPILSQCQEPLSYPHNKQYAQKLAPELLKLAKNKEELEIFEDKLTRFENCFDVLKSKTVMTDYETGDFDVISLKRYCKNSLCPICSKKRKLQIIDKYLLYFENYPKTKTHNIRFLTISPENYDSLEKGLFDLRTKFRKFLRLQYTKERVKGGIYVIETKYVQKGQPYTRKDSKGNEYEAGKHQKTGWNIHIHAIIYSKKLNNTIRGKCNDCKQSLLKYDKYSKNYYCANRKCNSLNVVVKSKDSKLTKEWQKCSNNQDVTMHIENAKTPLFMLNYMLKYISKQEDFSTLKSAAEYLYHTNKSRLINVFGCFSANHKEYIKPKKKESTKKYCYVSESELKPLENNFGENEKLNPKLPKYTLPYHKIIIEKLKSGPKTKEEILKGLPQSEITKFHDAFDSLRKKGDIYEPRVNVYQLV